MLVRLDYQLKSTCRFYCRDFEATTPEGAYDLLALEVDMDDVSNIKHTIVSEELTPGQVQEVQLHCKGKTEQGHNLEHLKHHCNEWVVELNCPKGFSSMQRNLAKGILKKELGLALRNGTVFNFACDGI